jgi:serine/threonine protein kinase/class 3 adenylate cyclase
MGWNDYQLLASLGTGPDGIRYQAKSIAGDAVELVLLADREGDDELKRHDRIAKARLLDHVHATRVLESVLDHSPRFVAMTPFPRTNLRDCVNDSVPLALDSLLNLSLALAGAMQAAHHLGTVHGRLSPSRIGMGGGDQLIVDFVGLDCGQTLVVDDVERSCLSSNEPAERDRDFAVDQYAFGAVLHWLLYGRTVGTSAVGAPHDDATLAPEALSTSQNLGELIQECLSREPEDRPSFVEIYRRLNAILERLHPGSNDLTRISERTPIVLNPTQPPERFGRFRIIQKIGQGGMGTVFKAEDETNGRIVAIKTLNPEMALNPASLKRFQKEARLLSAVRCPQVANLIEINEHDGLHYLAMEYVDGSSLRALLNKSKRFDEPTALRLTADICRALAEAHRRGIIHRDIKPENVLVRGTPPDVEIRLTDFGLARQIDQSASLDLTQNNVVGTPLYMAPEQGVARGTVDARSDVYSVGATLFTLLAGRPPFMGDSPLEVMLQHANEPLPSLKSLFPAASDGVCQIVEKAMAKRSDERYTDASAMLRDIERLLRGEPTSIVVHPILPATDPSRLMQYEFSWDLAASPEQLWPFISNTERFNHAIGLPAVQFTDQFDGRRMRRMGRLRKLGIESAWEEHPFEWVEGRRFGVLREMHRGPFRWFLSIVELNPRSGGGTRLIHRLLLEPRGLIGKLVARLEIGIRGRRAIDRVYRRIDATVTAKRPSICDAFEEPQGLTRSGRQRLQIGFSKLLSHGVTPTVAEQFIEFLGQAADQEVARIRPLALAARLGLDRDQFVAACLHAAGEGLLLLLWDILCPICRIPSQVHDTLKAVKEHGRCDACNLDFELDFANTVEMLFRVHPEIRPTELGKYCIGGPAHSPHVAAQVRVAAGERIELHLALSEGAYQLRGPQLPFAIDFRVGSNGVARWDLLLSRRPSDDLSRTLASGSQTIALTNDTEMELVVRVERIAPRTDALTAARAATLALFRELFPSETLSPGQLVQITHTAFLVTEVVNLDDLYRELGDATAFARLHEMFRLLEEITGREGGAVVKTIQGGVLAVFHQTVAAVRAALEVISEVTKHSTIHQLPVRVAVHHGPAFTTTLNQRLDYFGAAVNFAFQLTQFGKAGDVLLSSAVAGELDVAVLLAAANVQSDLIPGGDDSLPIHRVHPLNAHG